MGDLIKFKCVYCGKTFTLSKELVDIVEKIAKIKCPECGETEHIIETDN